MIPIELTEEHKEKLNIMIYKLFPEILQISYSYENLLHFNKKLESIHWFEFCMTYLANKVYSYEEVHQNEFQEDYYYNSILCENRLHPIDYLYEQFKKLKI